MEKYLTWFKVVPHTDREVWSLVRCMCFNTVQNLTVIDYANTSFTLDPNTNKWSIDMQVLKEVIFQMILNFSVLPG